MQKPQLVAVDTNIIMRLADGDDSTIDGWHLIHQRLRLVQFVVPPTVLGELASKTHDDPDPRVRQIAHAALAQMRLRWQMQPADFNALQEALAENAARHLRSSGLLPYEERNDAFVLSEASVLDCILLVSRDSHLLEIDHEKLVLLFRRLDLAAPLIASPEKLLKKFST